MEPDEIKRLMGKVTDKDLQPCYPSKFKVSSISDEALLRPSISEVTTNTLCLDYLSSADRVMRADFLNYLDHDYGQAGDPVERLDYVDVGCLARFILINFKTGNTSFFGEFFDRCECLLNQSDESIREFVVIGLFESLQNISGWHEVNYHTCFDTWLGGKSKLAWMDLIKFWGN